MTTLSIIDFMLVTIPFTLVGLLVVIMLIIAWLIILQLSNLLKKKSEER